MIDSLRGHRIVSIHVQKRMAYFADMSVVRFTSQALKVRALTEFKNRVILCDENTAIHCLPLLDYENISVVVVPSGEANKQWHQCTEVWEQWIKLGVNRQTEVIILGGGVLCDMGGLCAALFMRGIPFRLIPTTLLAMCDAAHGGKLAVDFGPLKNYIGLFKEAAEIIIWPSFLKSLPERHMNNGWVEMLKHGLIADKGHWEELNKVGQKNLLQREDLLQKSIAIKRAIVEQDPEEKGKRKILNAGHTVGHAIESACLELNLDVYHGEAVAAGLIAELLMAAELHLLAEEEVDKAVEVLSSFTPPYEILQNLDEQVLWGYARRDKKNDQQVLFSLIGPIGNCTENIPGNEMQFRKAYTGMIGRLK